MRFNADVSALTGSDGMGMDTRETYREIILENIEYDIIVQDKRLDRERLDEIVELLVDTVCSARQTIRVAGDDFPAEVVKSRLLKLDSGHIQYVLDCMAQNTTYVRNIKQWSAIDHKAKSIVINHTMCRGRKGYITGNLVKEASSYRTFALEPDVRDYLVRLYNHQRQMKLKYKDKYIDSDYICQWNNGRLIRPDYVSREFPKFLSANNLKVIRFHDLRHSAASNLLNAGFDIYEICEWLGHSDIRSTQRYLHLTFESKRRISKFMDNALFKRRRIITRYEEE